jgi:GMP synthase-like glutamine amidotransferase
MRLLSIVHQDDAGSGVFGETARERGFEVDEWRPDTGAEEPPSPLGEYDAALVFGGAMNVHEEHEHPWLAADKRVLGELLREHETPLLGVCLGAQLIADVAGGRVSRAEEPEIGWHPVRLAPAAASDPVAGALPSEFEALQWHSYSFEPPPGAVVLAESDICAQAFRLGERVWAVQFHAEVTDEILGHWIENYREDEDAVRIGFDPEAAAAEAARRLHDWNRLGAGLCGRFLDVAERAAASR